MVKHDVPLGQTKLKSFLQLRTLDSISRMYSILLLRYRWPAVLKSGFSKLWSLRASNKRSIVPRGFQLDLTLNTRCTHISNLS